VDDRQIRLLVVLSSMVIVAGLLYAFVPRRDAEPPWDDAATHTVWALDPERVERVSVTVGEGPEAVVVRDGAGWKLLAPEPRAADERRMGGLLRTLSGIELGVPITDSAPSELGLGDRPRGVIRLGLRGGEELTLRIGDEAPVGWQTYVTAPDGTAVAVPGHLAGDVLLTPADLRDAAVLRYALADVAAAELHSPRGSLRVAVDGEGAWWLEGYGRANLQAVDNLFVSLLDLRVDGFVDHLAPDGIAEPRHRAVVEVRDGTRIEARFGDVLPMGRLTQTAAGDVGTVPPQYLALLDQGPGDLMDRHAFPLRDGRVDRIDVAIDGRSVTLGGGDGAWQGPGLSGERAQRLVDALDRAAVDLPPREPIPELGEPTGRVRLHQGEARARLIEIGARDGAKRRIRDASGGPITTIDEAVLGRILDLLP
jgi:hypothetical protein